MFYTCPKCDKDAAKNDENNMELVKMQHQPNKQPSKEEFEQVGSNKDIGLTNNGNPVPKTKLVIITNDDESDENRQLLSQEEKRKKLTKAPKIDISYPSPPPYEEGVGSGRGDEFGQLLSS